MDKSESHRSLPEGVDREFFLFDPTVHTPSELETAKLAIGKMMTPELADNAQEFYADLLGRIDQASSSAPTEREVALQEIREDIERYPVGSITLHDLGSRVGYLEKQLVYVESKDDQPQMAKIIREQLHAIYETVRPFANKASV